MVILVFTRYYDCSSFAFLLATILEGFEIYTSLNLKIEYIHTLIRICLTGSNREFLFTKAFASMIIKNAKNAILQLKTDKCLILHDVYK